MPCTLSQQVAVETKHIAGNATLVASRYLTTRALCLSLLFPGGVALARLTINLYQVSDFLADNEFVCKSYAENEGMLEWLVSSGIAEVSDLMMVIMPDHGLTCSVLRLNPELSKIWQDFLESHNAD